MNMFKNLYKICAAALLTLGLFGCQEQELSKPIALLAESSLTFAAQDAEPQVLTIASDEGWVVDVDSDWIDIDATSGTGTVYANVSVSDNVDKNGKLAAPRQGKITIAATRGNYTIETVIYQKGDTYLEAGEYTVTELAALENTEETPQIPVKVKDATVVAVADEGFVISDGTTNVLVSGAREVAVGNKVNLNGQKVTANKLPVLLVDEVLGNDKGTEVTYPTATDISATLDSYNAEKVEYVSVSGTLVDNAILNIEGTSKSVNLYKTDALKEFNIHKVTVSGYSAGIVNGTLNFVAANVKDNGEDTEFGTAFPFSDDFSWLEPFIEMANSGLSAANQISDCVGSVISSADGACNIYTTLAGKVPVLETLRERGYVDLNPGLKTIYLQNAYFKFGATKKQSGLTLPFLKIDGTQDIAVSFRWCSQMQGDGKIDDTRMVVAFTGPGSIDGMKESTKVPGQMVSPDINHTQETNKMFWNDATVIIKGATRATRITIRPCDDVFGPEDDPVSSVHRFYMDDISVVNAADAVESKITVTGVDNNLITFEGTPDEPAQFVVSAEKEYKIYASAKWFAVDVTEGLGGEEKTVTVTCEPSELSTLRQGTITIKSGTSTHTINVVQSAAGQELDPYISLSTGNNVTVLGEGEGFSAKVQTNTTYEIETSDWIEVVETPVTKAKTEWFEHSFTAKVNLTGAPRKGYVRFYNEKLGIESVLNVEQENFEARIDVIPVTPCLGISGYGATYSYKLDASIPYSVSTDAAWVTLPAAEGPAGEVTVPITFAANTDANVRTATITFTNPAYDYTKTVEINQFPAGVYFQDDFSWLMPMITEYNAANSNPIGNPVTGYDEADWKTAAGANAPNIYSTEPFKTYFPSALAAAGYEDMNPSAKVVYPQDCYLKFGKTSVHTSLKLPSVPMAAAGDIMIEFDWCAHVQGSGKVDPVQLVLCITGNGAFENGTKYSDPLVSAQSNTQHFMWNRASVKVVGADKDTRVNIVWKDVVNKETGEYNWTKSTAERFHLDNILIK